MRGRVGIPQREIHLFYGMPLYNLEVINFYDKHGLSATIDAYGVSRATIFRWKKSLKSSRGLKTVSASTIGKIIKRYKLIYSSTGRVYHNPNSKRANKGRSYRARVKRSPKEKEGGYIEIDSITKFVDGIRVYIINAIDVKFRFKFAYAYSSLSSNSALDFFKKLEEVYPYERGIEHKFTYPRCPKINGYIERANRTLKEEFLEENIYLVAEGINELNSSLIDYVIWYNTKRVHKSLNNLSPTDYMLKCNPESQMYVTHTIMSGIIEYGWSNENEGCNFSRWFWNKIE